VSMEETQKAEKCRSCGADVIWALSRNGKPMPFDAKPVTGIYYLIDGIHPEEKLAVHATRPETGPLFRSHFATCPDAEKWRKHR
jgi:hypothetical protein